MINVAAGYRIGRAQGRSLRVAPAGARPPGAAPSAPAGARARSSRGRRIDAAPARIAALGHFRILAAEGVEAVAVCYLHSYRSPEHERATAEALARALPAAYVSLSSDVFPQIQGVRAGLHHRGQRVRGTRTRALSPASRRAPDGAGYAGPLLIMQSHGGLATVADAVRLAAGGVLSGPAGGVAAARHASRILEHGNLIAFDMGERAPICRSSSRARRRSPPIDGVPLGAGAAKFFDSFFPDRSRMRGSTLRPAGAPAGVMRIDAGRAEHDSARPFSMQCLPRSENRAMTDDTRYQPVRPRLAVAGDAGDPGRIQSGDGAGDGSESPGGRGGAGRCGGGLARPRPRLLRGRRIRTRSRWCPPRDLRVERLAKRSDLVDPECLRTTRAPPAGRLSCAARVRPRSRTLHHRSGRPAPLRRARECRRPSAPTPR